MEIEICSPSNRVLCKTSVNSNTVIKDVKTKIAGPSKIKLSRQSLRLEARGKDLKDTLTIGDLGLKNGSKLYVKDLGPQISWSLVFLCEYMGPVLIYLLVFYKPAIFYNYELEKKVVRPLYDLPMLLWSIHYNKRVLETIFVHRFSHGTMPLRNLFKNCSYYWGFALYIAYHINHPLYTAPPQIVRLLGVLIFTFGEIGNLSIHLLLRNLRPPGSQVRRIPVPNSNIFTILFNFVSCPNYTYEYISWIGFTIATSCLPAGIFALAGMFQMTVWALGKHRNYKKEFSDYPRSRKAIIPFVL